MIDWIAHLDELRKRMIVLVLGFAFLFAIFLYFSNTIFSLVALPLLNAMPSGGHLIATQVIAPLTVPIKVAFYTAAFVSMPFFFYQLWSFISPALYQQEKFLIGPLVLICSLLFFLGVFFAYYLVCPMAFKFFSSALPSQVIMMTDINDYLTFIMQLMFAFGICFEVPVIIFLLYYFGILNQALVKKIRPYVIVMAFVLGMLLTPPDVVSQIMLAIPLWMFFELGILFAKLILRQR